MNESTAKRLKKALGLDLVLDDQGNVIKEKCTNWKQLHTGLIEGIDYGRKACARRLRQNLFEHPMAVKLASERKLTALLNRADSQQSITEKE